MEQCELQSPPSAGRLRNRKKCLPFPGFFQAGGPPWLKGARGIQHLRGAALHWNHAKRRNDRVRPDRKPSPSTFL